MKTALYEKHQNLGAKIVDFAGFQMPVQYKGILHEHAAVRKSAGIFDVSHMGLINIRGEEAESFLNYLSVNKISKNDFSATYTVFCNEKGGSVDDLIIYKKNVNDFFVVVNASNRQKDFEHLHLHAKRYNVKIETLFDTHGIIAIQGPLVKAITEEIFPKADEIKPFRFLPLPYRNQEIILSATGYTGSGGFEIYGPNDAILDLWDLFITKSLEPCGLGARDILRLEKGYALYGHELSDTIAPTESVSAWTVKFDKPDFLGKEALLNLEKSPHKRNQYGVVLLDRGIARENYPVFHQGKEIGLVTSGTMSPMLNKAISIILVKEKFNIGDLVEIKIRQNLVNAQIVNLPFLP